MRTDTFQDASKPESMPADFQARRFRLLDGSASRLSLTATPIPWRTLISGFDEADRRSASGYAYADEFTYGLDLILDGLASRHIEQSPEDH
ncbi:hypothetical protein [Nocardia asiatica]|uniref:hypothetical protein n=1 Tax=Nocardia asiatica TaxID=209252 RepID=UPI003EE22DD2